MPWFIGDYLRDTAHLEAHEHGAYMMMLAHAWQHQGALPLDDERLRKIGKLSPEQWAGSRSTLMEFWQKNGVAYRQKRVDAELDRAKALYQQRVDAGRASAAKRAGNERSTTAQRALNEPESPSESEPPIPPPKKHTSRRAKRSAPVSLPDGFGESWSPSMQTWLERREETQVKAHLIHFVGWAKAKGAVYADWEQAFQNAIRDDWAKVRSVQI